jgi:hypothetical protein
MSDKGYHATLKIPFLTFWPSERSGVLYANDKRAYAHGRCRKMTGLRALRLSPS